MLKIDFWITSKMAVYYSINDGVLVKAEISDIEAAGSADKTFYRLDRHINEYTDSVGNKREYRLLDPLLARYILNIRIPNNIYYDNEQTLIHTKGYFDVFRRKHGYYLSFNRDGVLQLRCLWIKDQCIESITFITNNSSDGHRYIERFENGKRITNRCYRKDSTIFYAGHATGQRYSVDSDTNITSFRYYMSESDYIYILFENNRPVMICKPGSEITI